MPSFRTNTSGFIGRPLFLKEMFDKKMSVLNSDNALHAGIEVIQYKLSFTLVSSSSNFFVDVIPSCY